MKNITTIQKQVEGRNFDIRKHILEYDDVLNHHRLAIYSRRNKVLSGADIHAEVLEMLRNEVDRIIDVVHSDDMYIDSDNKSKIIDEINKFTGSESITMEDILSIEDYPHIKNKIFSLLSGKIESLRDTGTEEDFAEFERRFMLASLDELWMHHIDNMAHLREEVAFE